MFGLTGLYLRMAQLGAIAAVLLGLYGAYHHQISTSFDAGAASVQKLRDIETAERNALAETARENERVKGAIHAEELADERKARADEVAVLAAGRAGDRALIERLRATRTATTGAVQAGEASSPGPGSDAAAAADGDVLGACATELVELGYQTEGLATQLRGLQAWSRSAMTLCGPQLDE